MGLQLPSLGLISTAPLSPLTMLAPTPQINFVEQCKTRAHTLAQTRTFGHCDCDWPSDLQRQASKCLANVTTRLDRPRRSARKVGRAHGDRTHEREGEREGEGDGEGEGEGKGGASVNPGVVHWDVARAQKYTRPVSAKSLCRSAYNPGTASAQTRDAMRRGFLAKKR